MIYCVVPEALADELYDKLASYYADDPNVTVIIDRRKSKGGPPPAEGERRERRRARVPGDFPPLATD